MVGDVAWFMTLLGEGLDVDVLEAPSDPRNMGVMPNAARTECASCECVLVEWTGELEREPTGLPCPEAEPAERE